MLILTILDNIYGWPEIKKLMEGIQVDASSFLLHVKSQWRGHFSVNKKSLDCPSKLRRVAFQTAEC